MPVGSAPASGDARRWIGQGGTRSPSALVKATRLRRHYFNIERRSARSTSKQLHGFQSRLALCTP
jgi:hypothetical protein